jgi:pimeloyl-ACP methyl ester carboxylesterase
VPAFDVDVMVTALEAAREAAWKEWAAIRAPALVVRGENGDMDADEADAMLRALPSAELVTIPGAGHDVHLDVPEAWRGALEGFLARLS